MTPIVILAAGSSNRLARPKQNLIFEGKTLLQRAVTEANAASDDVLVILGAHIDQIEPTIENLNVKMLYNRHWEEGMATSVNLAVKLLLAKSAVADGVLFILCDQPYVTTSLLRNIIATGINSEKGIAACFYGNCPGVPAYFSNMHFAELLKLTGKEGAKKLLEKFAGNISLIPFPLGNADIDTEEDYNNLYPGNL